MNQAQHNHAHADANVADIGVEGFMGDYAHEPSLSHVPRTLWNLPKIAVMALIRLYQATISKGLPANTCRFYPSCSHYGYQAVYRYGAVKGSLMAIWRVLRCNPFNPGGYDPVP